MTTLPSSITTRLQYQHKSLLELIEGLNDEQIRMAIIPGKWSVFEHIVHLETYQHTFIERLGRILESASVVFPPYSAESDPLFHDHLTHSSWQVIQDLMGTRRDLAAAVAGFNETDRAKTGIHGTYGELDITGWLNFFLLHESHHLFTIFKMAALLKTRNY